MAHGKAPKWGYRGNHGPEHWHENYKIAKTGQKQSPINIATSEAEYDDDQSSNNLNINYSRGDEGMSLINNGHSIMCKINSKKDFCEVSGGPLKEKYRLEQFHLHWGSTDDKGSEHTIDGKQYSAELHLVHYNTKYGDFSEAVDKDEGLAVLGVMINSGKENQAFRKITEKIPNVQQTGSSVTLETGSVDIEGLLPGNTSDYWTYEGSLTTPPLYESVHWIVFKDSVDLSPDQLKGLRSLSDAEGESIQDNFRPPVPLVSGRTVKASFRQGMMSQQNIQ